MKGNKMTRKHKHIKTTHKGGFRYGNSSGHTYTPGETLISSPRSRTRTRTKPKTKKRSRWF